MIIKAETSRNAFVRFSFLRRLNENFIHQTSKKKILSLQIEKVSYLPREGWINWLFLLGMSQKPRFEK